jgi:hypothetical protein
VKYRNSLVHGDVTARISSWGKLAQDIETLDYAALAHTTTVAMVETVADHFGLVRPAWAS